VIDAVPGWGSRARVATVLSGGITNRNHVVEVDGDRFVVRLPGRDTELLEIDRETERLANQRAAEFGFAPPVVGLVHGCLVTRFVSGTPLEAAQCSEPRVVTAVAGCLRRFHATPPLAHTFDAFRVPAQHLAAATARGVARPAAYDRVAEIVAEIAAAFAATPDPRCPCHNDLLSANLLDDDGHLWLLDWEYAGMNDPSFDLGNFAVNNGLGAEAEAELVRTYYGTVTPRTLARLRLMKLVSDAREAMWAVVQQAISSLEFDYASYAAERFERLLSNAAAPGYAALLADAALPRRPS